MAIKNPFCPFDIMLAGIVLGLIGGAIAVWSPAEEPAAPAVEEVAIVQESSGAVTEDFQETQKVSGPVERVPSPAPGYYRADVPLSEAEQVLLYEAAAEFGVPHELALAVVWRESDFRNITGDGGASVGFMQIQPRWWSELASDLGVSDLHDPQGNFRTGCAILSMYLEKYGDTHKALMAYNCGEPVASKLWASGITSSEYSQSVVAYAAAL